MDYKHNLPEVSFQFFLLEHSGHNWPHEDFIGDGSNDKITKNTQRSDPTSAAKSKTMKSA